jgi:hypothetical protein
MKSLVLLLLVALSFCLLPSFRTFPTQGSVGLPPSWIGALEADEDDDVPHNADCTYELFSCGTPNAKCTQVGGTCSLPSPFMPMMSMADIMAAQAFAWQDPDGDGCGCSF